VPTSFAYRNAERGIMSLSIKRMGAVVALILATPTSNDFTSVAITRLTRFGNSFDAGHSFL
ncbi:MAG: hypothetical protein AB7T05_00615, partial [Fimbriimonadaceae bacterium]